MIGVRPTHLEAYGGPFVVVDSLGYELSRHDEVEDGQYAMRTAPVARGAIAVVRTIDAKLMAYLAPAAFDVRMAERRAMRAAEAWSDTAYARVTSEGRA